VASVSRPVRAIRQTRRLLPRLKPSPEAALPQGALRLSAHVPAADAGQFASRMAGRLLVHCDSLTFQTFAVELAAAARAPWLRPLHPALHPSGIKLLRTLEGHGSVVNGVAVTPDGKPAVSTSDDETLKVWDLETGHALRTLEGDGSVVNGAAVTPDGKRAVSASDDKTLKVWDLETGRQVVTFHCDASPLGCTFASNRKIIAGDRIGRLHFLMLEEHGLT